MNHANIPAWAIELGKSRNGLCALCPERTALIVVDLQNAFLASGETLANPHARDIVPNVNAIAQALRRRGGRVVFLRHTVSDDPRYKLTEWQARMVPRTADGDFQLRAGTFGHQLYPELDVSAHDLTVDKHRFSAFLPNSSDLDAILRHWGIDTLVITGTVTNVCCESTARDANMLGYKVVFVGDATAAFTDEEHNAALLSMATVFAEVRDTRATIELIGSAPGPAKESCLAATYFLDHDSPSVSQFATEACKGIGGEREKAVALYYAVRDGIRYDAYRIDFSREGFRASRALADGYGFCISKAALLCAAARRVGIPARMGFGDVRNHLSTEKLRLKMKTDIFIFHGYSELWIEGRWVKATPAFNLSLCTKFGVLPLEFDGRTDSLFHPFKADGSLHMEYVQDRGTFSDIPFDLIHSTWTAQMKQTRGALEARLEGDFAEDGARERSVTEPR
jgi:nicotinamidase-related amidase